MSGPVNYCVVSTRIIAVTRQPSRACPDDAFGDSYWPGLSAQAASRAPSIRCAEPDAQDEGMPASAAQMGVYSE